MVHRFDKRKRKLTSPPASLSQIIALEGVVEEGGGRGSLSCNVELLVATPCLLSIDTTILTIYIQMCCLSYHPRLSTPCLPSVCICVCVCKYDFVGVFVCVYVRTC